MRKIVKWDLWNLADEAYAYGLTAGPDGYDRGYASGVEDLALLLSTEDPAISERLVSILHAAGLSDAVPVPAVPAPAVSSFEDDAEYGAGWDEPPVSLPARG